MDFFDRKTFNPIENNKHKQILTVLRQKGRKRKQEFLQHHSVAHQSTAMKWALEYAQKGGVFFDLGCGDSADVAIAQKLGFTAQGFDLFPPFDYDAETSDNSFILTDVVERIPYSAGFADVVIAQAMLDLIEPNMRKTFFQEVNRVLKPKGVFACLVQWLQSGYGIDLEEEFARAKQVFTGQFYKKANGFVFVKGV